MDGCSKDKQKLRPRTLVGVEITGRLRDHYSQFAKFTGHYKDYGPGTLRQGCRSKEPLWIVFEVWGTIHLSSYLDVSSYKTIDGRGQRVKLTGKGLRLKECEHVIICNLEFEGYYGISVDADGIQIKPNSKHIWIDRCSLYDYDDGHIDITQKSTDITVSRCHLSQHNKTMLIGADPSHIDNRCICVAIHHCFFDGIKQRHPRVRFAKIQLYNNYTKIWGIYAVFAIVESQIYSQCNIYEAGQKKMAFKCLTEKVYALVLFSTQYISEFCLSLRTFGFN
ncbi:probable pectate lyase 4 [Juglans microcarpa x Juglans regia]|uniref:probable pectate lyase 4 n=1 Tax=Juglans microcarpa x Juglans regia TaxID=2249226 RepID=UPI001B7E9CA2|nr:probable pectate lyase 4 [Juglans microcarpa x Juglans regia]